MTIIQGTARDDGDHRYREQPYSEGPFAETAWTPEKE